MDNQYEDSLIKKDTFSNGTLKPFFGINGFKTGKQKVKLMIEEQVLETKSKEKDSFLEIMKVRHEYEFIITVVEKKYTSKLEKELLKKMKEESER